VRSVDASWTLLVKRRASYTSQAHSLRNDRLLALHQRCR